MEAMGKLIKMNTVIVGLRGLGVEVAKNLILAGPRSVSIYDPDLVRINDLGANFYCEEAHVGQVSRAEACLAKLSELNPHVKVDVIADQKSLMGVIASGQCQVVCQTELVLTDAFLDPNELNKACRAKGVGYISSQTFGPWGYGFVDFGDSHTIFDHDGEQCKSFIVIQVDKGEKTTVQIHDDQRHIYQAGDHVVFSEVEGMVELNGRAPVKVVDTTVKSLTLELDSRGFADYTR